MAGIFLFDKNQNLIKSIKEDSLIENYQESELGGMITGYVSFPFNLHTDDALFYGVKDIDNFHLYRIIQNKKHKNQISLVGIHVFYDELKTKVIKDIRPTNRTADQMIAQILDGTGWSVKSSDVQGVKSSNYYYQSTLSAFNHAIGLFNCEYLPVITWQNGKITKKEVELKNFIEKDNGRWYEIGDKLVTVEAESNLGEIYTAYIGRGKGEELTDEEGNATGGYGRKIKFDTIEWTTPKNPLNKPMGSEVLVFPGAESIYGYRETTVDFDSIDDVNELLQATYEYGLINSRPKIQLKATAVDQGVRLGEVCSVINPKLDIRYKTRVFKLRKDHLANNRVDFEFGDRIVTSIAQRLSAQSEEIQSTKNEVQSTVESLRQRIIGQATNYYFNEDGYNYELTVGNEYDLPAGYYSFDKPIKENPTKVIYMGAGKMLISNEKDSNGEWIWTTGATGDGIHGESIIANSITANKLAADVGQSLDLSSNTSIRSTVGDIVDNYVNENIDNLKGADGKTSYTHIAYANELENFENLARDTTLRIKEGQEKASLLKTKNLNIGTKYVIKFKANCNIFSQNVVAEGNNANKILDWGERPNYIFEGGKG